MIPVDRDVLPKSAQQVFEQLDRKLAGANRVGEGCKDQITIVLAPCRSGALRRLVQTLPPVIQERQPFTLGALTLIREIIGPPGKGVDRCNVRPHRRRQQSRRDRKVLVVIAGDRQTPVVGTGQ